MCWQTYVITTWKRKRQRAKTLKSGKKTSWLRGWQEAGVPASVNTHPEYNSEENLSVMSETESREHSQKCSSTWRAQAVSQTTADWSCRDQVHLQLISSYYSSVPATTTCLVHYTSVCCILSHRTVPQSSATLHSANYAILHVEAPPKLPFC